MENNDMGSVELEELEVLEIDATLLRDFLEEEHEVDDGGIEQLVEVDENKNMMTDKEEQEEEKQQQRWLEQNQSGHVHDFEWLNMMEMETVSPNEAIVDNWYPDDIVGLPDFGYTNCEYGYSQICDVIVSDETSYGCLWENL